MVEAGRSIAAAVSAATASASGASDTTAGPDFFLQQMM